MNGHSSKIEDIIFVKLEVYGTTYGSIDQLFVKSI